MRADTDHLGALDRPAIRALKLQQAAQLIFEAIGEDPTRAGLRETPARFARFWLEFVADYRDASITRTFPNEQNGGHYDQLIVVSDMRIWSLCEHHLLPFWCDVAIGYLPRQKLIGLSKLGRIARLAGRALMTQERLVEKIATTVRQIVEAPDVAVVAVGEHLCMTMRGVAMPSKMSTDVMWGKFRTDAGARDEFMRRAWGSGDRR